jgi:Cys-tRNA(Pro)/Cys-tRNA(Cys) deacylase
MTPAIDLLKQRKIAHQIHEYQHDPAAHSYGLEAAEKMGVPVERVFKTLVVSLDEGKLAVGLVPVSCQLSLKQIAKAAGAKKATMADKTLVQRATGYVLGGVSPLGQKKRLPTYIDVTARDFATVFISAGRRGLDIELAPGDLCALLGGEFVELRA